MKNMLKVVAGFLIINAFLLVCDKYDELDGGCQTGIRKGSKHRTFIRCCTQREALAADNVEDGGISDWSDYTDHQWEKCADCK